MSMKRIPAAALAVSVYIISTCGSGPAFAQSAAQRFRAYDGAAHIDASRLAGLRATQNVRVVVVMSEDSIATARAKSATHSIADTERAAIEQRVSAQHESVRPAIEAHGGKVMATFHGALNGIKVEVHPSQLGALAALPGVVSVLPVGKYHLDNIVSVPFIGTPAVWQGTPGFRGEGIKIAIIDTGVDYTHANFGGPGTTAAFAAAQASSTLPADPALFGPGAPKVKGGTDLVGDKYDANSTNPAINTPMPDPNPLDCNGHGSHTSGTATGFGVTSSGATYQGPYDSSIYATPQNFTIGPGVAPKADLYMVRVFGCSGSASTDVVVEAIDWAVQNDMDVISMSLGSDEGPPNTADALASTNAAKAGIVVAVAAGNAGPAPYVLGSPASGDGSIAAAATDAHASFPGATVTPVPGTALTAQDSNGVALPTTALPVVVLRTTTGAVSLGCTPAEYTAAGVTGKLVVVQRGVCARVARAVYGQQAGAAAVAMINTSPGYPPFEGAITSNPDTGQAYTVTIPFLGVLTTDAADLAGAASATFAATTIPNPGFRVAAGFSSSGPRWNDSILKPNSTAPGVSVVSTLVGSGTGATTESGTSMATPHIAGVGALTLQAHPRWSEERLAAAIVETSDPTALADYWPSLEGAGLVQPLGATRTNAVVLSENNPLANSVSYGFSEFTRDFRASQLLRVVNDGPPVTFNVTATAVGGAPHTVSLSRSTVTAGGEEGASLGVTLSVPAATVGSTHDASGNDTFQEVLGYLTFTPANPSMNNGVSLHVPYYLVPRARSAVLASLSGRFSPRHPSGSVRLSNRGGAIAGNGDFYAWGLSGTRQGVRAFDVRAVGVQTNPGIPAAGDSLLVFAVNTFDRFSSATSGGFDILIDTTGTGVPNYDVFAGDLGFLTTGSFDGVMVAGVANLVTGAASINFNADAPTDGSIVEIPVFASMLGLSASSSSFTYQVNYANNFDGTAGHVPGTASFDVFNPAISNAQFVPVAPGTTASVPVAITPAQWAKQPALGLMVVTEDNRSGGSQANLLRVGGGD
jgi:minor extracellular serine protease Vpr